MQFTNPLTSIDAVTDFVPTVSRDLWFWPCVAGESFAPTFSGGAGYSHAYGAPIVTASGAAGDESVTWPVIGRWSPTDAKSTATITVVLMPGTGGAFTASGLVNVNFPEVSVDTSVNTVTVTDTAGTSYQFPFAALPADGAMVQIVLDPAGNVTVLVAGTQVAYVAGAWPAKAGALQISLTASTTVEQISATGLQVAYS